MDDWNRQEERWEMDCAKCAEEYSLFGYSCEDSGMICRSSLWVRKTELKRLRKIKAELASAKGEVAKLAKARYMDRWLSFFRDVKSKKEIWRRLTDDDKRYPSLSAFYDHIRDTNIQSYLRAEFSYEHVPWILKKLGVVDKEIDKKLQLVKQIDLEVQKIRNRLIKEGYR